MTLEVEIPKDPLPGPRLITVVLENTVLTADCHVLVVT
jgi:hypothetical protein